MDAADNPGFTITPAVYSEVANAIRPHISAITADPRHSLTHVRVRVSGDRLRVEASDGFTLIAATMNVANRTGGDIDVLAPGAAFCSLKPRKRARDSVVWARDSVVWFSVTGEGTATLTDFATTVALALSDGQGFDADVLMGAFCDAAPPTIDDGITFSPAILARLKTLPKGCHVHLRFRGPNNAALATCTGAAEYQVAIMPMRMPDGATAPVWERWKGANVERQVA